MKKRMPRIRVLIADDHSLFAEALQAILGTDGRFETVALARTAARRSSCAEALEPDVVLMDISMPVLDGFEATREAAQEGVPETPVLMLTGSNAPHDVDKARARGRGRLRHEGSHRQRADRGDRRGREASG